MRNLIWLSILLTYTSWARTSYPSVAKAGWLPSADEIEMRDSIFEEAKGKVSISDRIVFLRNAFEEENEFTKEYLDSAMVWAINSGDLMEQGKLHISFYKYYETRHQKRRMLEIFESIKEMMNAHPELNLSQIYFRIWVSLGQKQVLEGHIEEAKFQAIEMLKESERLNSNDGRFYSYFLSSFAYFQVQTEESKRTSLQYLKKADELPNLAYMHQRWILSRYYSYYIYSKNYEEARNCLRKELALLEKEIGADFSLEKKKQPIILRNDMRMATLFRRENNLDSIKFYLEKAEKHYLSGIYNPSYMNLKHQWVNYYRSLAKLEEKNSSGKENDFLRKALEHCNEALEKGKNLYLIRQVEMKLSKAELLKDLGYEKESAELLRNITLCRDSLNKASHESHIQAHETNYRINQYLQKQIKRQRTIYIMFAFVALTLLIFLLYVIMRMLFSERENRVKKRKIEALYAETELSNRLKNIFLKRIVSAIQIPLDNVLKCAERLSDSTELAWEERIECSQSIKKYSKRLLNLVLNVLELSRLEAEMVRFELVEVDLFVLFQDVKEEIESSADSNVTIDITSTSPQVLVTVDYDYFRKVLLSVLKPLYVLESPQHISVTISVGASITFLSIHGSPLFVLEGEEIAVIHQMNEKLLQSMGGNYTIAIENGSSSLCLSFPI